MLLSHLEDIDLIVPDYQLKIVFGFVLDLERDLEKDLEREKKRDFERERERDFERERERVVC
jgi:hypothetical protein